MEGWLTAINKLNATKKPNKRTLNKTEAKHLLDSQSRIPAKLCKYWSFEEYIQQEAKKSVYSL